MDDSLFVSRGQPARHLQRIVNRLTTGNQPTPYAFAQRLPFQQFRDDIRRAALFPNIENRKNVGMIQRGRRARFLHEPLQAGRICRECRWQNLDRHNAIQPRVASAVDFAHSSSTQ